MALTSQQSRMNQLTRRSIFSTLLTLAAIILMISSAESFIPVPGGIGPHTLNAVVLALLGGAALLAALRSSMHRVEAATVAEQPISQGKINWVLLLPGLALLALGTEMSANVSENGVLLGISPHIQFITLLIGLVLFTLGGIGISSLLKPRIAWREALPLLAIVALAFAVRIYELGTLVRIPADEGHYMSGASAFLDPYYTPRMLTALTSSLPVTMIFSYWNYVASLIWGQSFFGLRIVNVIIGTLTVVVAYGIGRTLFNRRIGLLAALILATFPSHVFFSRIVVPHIADAFIFSLAVLFAARAFRWNWRQDWVLLGVCIGVGQYFYEVGRLVIPPVFVCWIILIAIVLGRKFVVLRKGVFLAAVVSLIIMTPVYFTMWYRELPFVTRITTSGVDLSLFERAFQGTLNEDEVRYLANHLANPFLVYTSYTNRGLRELYSGLEPLVLRTVVPLFLLGIFHLLYRFRSAGMLLLVAIFGTSAANILAADGVIFVRYTVIIPLLAIIVAIGIGCTVPMLNPFSKDGSAESSAPELRRRWQGVYVYGVALLVSVVQFYYFFGHMVPEYNYDQRFLLGIGDTMDATMRFAERPNVLHEQMWIYDPNYGNGLVPTAYITYTLGPGDYTIEMRVSGETTVEALDALPRDRTYVFAVLPSDLRMIQLLRQSFVLEPPTYSSYISPVPHTLYVMFVAPHEKNLYPLHATPGGLGTVP